MHNLRTPEKDRLFQAILSLENIDECYRFFADNCTIKELEELSKRFKVSEMLYDGQSYAKICKETGVSTATICRVNRCIEYGSGGYKLVHERLNKQD